MTALTNACFFECNAAATTGNVNGGGFNPKNTHGISNGAVLLGTGNSPTLSSASYSFVAGDVGAWVFFPAQTNMTAGWYQIASQTLGVATLNAAAGAAVQFNNSRLFPSTVAGCATTASPTGVTFLIDYSQGTTAIATATDIAVVTGTTLTSTTIAFAANHVGNLIHITAGTATAGWYEIVSVVAGTATIDRSAVTTGINNTGQLGGALSLGTADGTALSLGVGLTTSASKYYFKNNGAFTLSSTPTVSTAGGTQFPLVYEGYNALRGDRPTGTGRPSFNLGANTLLFSGGGQDLYCADMNGTAASVFSATVSGVRAYNCKAANKSTTAARTAFNLTGNGVGIFACEAISYLGNGIVVADASENISTVSGCYVHDCNIGITNPCIVNNTIVAGCTTEAVLTVSAQQGSYIQSNTFYGQENKLGIGVSLVSTLASCMDMRNNIFYGFATGISSAVVSGAVVSDYNTYSNNTADLNDVTKIQKGPHDIAVNPAFTNVVQRTMSTATTTSGNHLVQSGATFVTWGVTAGVDCVYISAGTGVTAGIYGILSVDSETQITTDIALTANATADKVWSITTGHNFLPTGAI